MGFGQSKIPDKPKENHWVELLSRLERFMGIKQSRIISDLKSIEKQHPEAGIYIIVQSYYLTEGDVTSSVEFIDNHPLYKVFQPANSVESEVNSLLHTLVISPKIQSVLIGQSE